SGDPFPVMPDTTILGFTLGISLVAAALFGILPALQSTANALPRARVRSTLVVAQVTLSVVLAVLAGLFGHSLSQLRGVNLGFRNQNVIALSLDYPRSWAPAQRNAARDQFADAVAAMPGASQVSYGFPGPFLGGTSSATVHVPGSPAAREQ